MGQRSKQALRCTRCRMHIASCLCSEIPHLNLSTHLALVIHHREMQKPTATGPLAVAALANSTLYVHGQRENPLNLQHLHNNNTRVLLLYPSEGAVLLEKALQNSDGRPITLVVPDGNWRQASSIAKRVAGLEHAERVTLPSGVPSQWGVRTERHPEGLATFEAISRALAILESKEIEAQLNTLFDKMVETVFTSRGEHRPITSTHQTIINKLEIIFQNKYMVAINKPSGMITHRGLAQDETPILQLLRDQLGRYLYPVHRLDRGTSGVLMFAFSSEMAHDIQLLFSQNSNNNIVKRYIALCRGNSQDLTYVDHALIRDKPGQSRITQNAVTTFKLLGGFERYGLYEAFPREGRTHQIRRHLKHKSHPIIGDVRYGKGEHNRLFRERFNFHRLALHCCSLAFKNPRGGEEITLKAPLPDDFKLLLTQLKLIDLVTI